MSNVSAVTVSPDTYTTVVLAAPGVLLLLGAIAVFPPALPPTVGPYLLSVVLALNGAGYVLYLRTLYRNLGATFTLGSDRLTISRPLGRDRTIALADVTDVERTDSIYPEMLFRWESHENAHTRRVGSVRVAHDRGEPVTLSYVGNDLELADDIRTRSSRQGAPVEPQSDGSVPDWLRD